MENYFRDALHNFVFEEAGGGAIRHLANRGYTAKKIAESLSFPIPYEKVREAFTKHLLDSRILLREEPAAGAVREKTEYVREYDKYGKPSFRRVTVREQAGVRAETGVPAGKKMSAETDGEREWESMDFEKFVRLYRDGTGKIKLTAETELAGAERNIYISCNFGADREGKMRAVLDAAEAEYIEGICWTGRTMYHLLDRRMFGIAVKLWEAERQGGETAEKIAAKKMPGEKMKAKKSEEAASEIVSVGKVYIRR